MSIGKTCNRKQTYRKRWSKHCHNNGAAAAAADCGDMCTCADGCDYDSEHAAGTGTNNAAQVDLGEEGSKSNIMTRMREITDAHG